MSASNNDKRLVTCKVSLLIITMSVLAFSGTIRIRPYSGTDVVSFGDKSKGAVTSIMTSI